MVRRSLCLVVRRKTRKCDESLRKGGVRSNPLQKGSSSDINPHKGRGKDQKGKGNEGAYPQSGFAASETPSEEGRGHSSESDD